MLFLDPVDPSACCSTDGTRYLLNGVCIRGRHAIATDGRVLFVTGIVTEDPEGHKTDVIIPSRAIRAARKKGRKSRRSKLKPKDFPDITFSPESRSINVHVRCDETNTYREIIPGANDSYPKNIQNVIRAASQTSAVLSVNIRLLAKLAESFGHDVIHLHLSPEKFNGHYDGTVFVTAGDSQDHLPNSIGAIMPVRFCESQSVTLKSFVSDFLSENPITPAP